MRTATPAPVFANIAFLRLPRFDERPVVEQAALKERLEARVRTAITGLPAAERIVLDASDGMALVLFGEPARTLDLAQSLRAEPGEEPLEIGVNHGPIAVTGRDAAAMVFGDGLTAAAAAARFATGGRLLVNLDLARGDPIAVVQPRFRPEAVSAGDRKPTSLESFYPAASRKDTRRLAR